MREASSDIKPYLAIFFSLIIAIALIGDIYFLETLESHWQLALGLLLMTTIVIAFIQVARSEKEIKNISEQLDATKERLANELKHRLWAEKTASETKIKSQIIDENIPVMLAYFNPELRCRYHNRIYRRWFGLAADKIDNHLLGEFANEEFSSAIQTSLTEILTGKTVHKERILKSTKGFPYIFTEQYIPHLDNKGKAIGLYTLHTPRAQEKHRAHVKLKTNETNQSSFQSKPNEPTMKSTPSTPQESPASKGGITATRISEAIDSGEFKLYCQKIAAIKPSPSATPHYEILIRMNEEENNLMPPGSFLPLVEQFKLMPKLDRWIINHIIQWLAIHPKTRTVFNLNIAQDTLADHSLCEFIQKQLQKTKIPAASLCFEVESYDVEANLENARVFIQKIREIGCQVALCSFNGCSESMNFVEKIKVDYVKIDGSIVCNILRDEDDLVQIKAIAHFAQQASIKTIAELVETDEISAKLQEIGIDFGQGFGIEQPHPFDELESES